MPSIHISEELAARLHETAEMLGVTADDLATDTLALSLDDHVVRPDDLTPAQLDRMKHSIAQIDRGEYITEVEVAQIFDDLIATLAARKEAA